MPSSWYVESTQWSCILSPSVPGFFSPNSPSVSTHTVRLRCAKHSDQCKECEKESLGPCQKVSHALTQSIILCCWEIPKWIIHLRNKWLMSKHLLMQTKLTEINGWITHCLEIYKSNIYYNQINQNYKGFSAAFQNACQKLVKWQQEG